MAKNPNRWDTSNWTPGKVSLANALGLGSWNIHYPTLQASLQNQAVAAQPSPPGNNKTNGSPGNNTAAPGSIGPCNSATTTANKRLMQQEAQAYGWGSGAEWDALNNVVMSESGYCNTIKNPTSTAYGIGQFLDNTWATVGGTKTSSPQIQIRLMLAYIKQRYGTPSKAWQFHLANNYY